MSNSKAQIRRDGNWIEFDPNGNDNWCYDIDIRDLIKPGGMSHWMEHLEEKTWFDARMRERITSLVKQYRDQKTI